jgi:hypothetical protein
MQITCQFAAYVRSSYCTYAIYAYDENATADVLMWGVEIDDIVALNTQAHTLLAKVEDARVVAGGSAGSLVVPSLKKEVLVVTVLVVAVVLIVQWE